MADWIITLTIPEAVRESFANALAVRYQYLDRIVDPVIRGLIDNPQSKEEFVEAKIFETLLGSVKEYEELAGVQGVQAQLRTQVEAKYRDVVHVPRVVAEPRN